MSLTKPCVEDQARRLENKRATGIHDPTPYDVLIDVVSGPAHRAAVNEARQLCGRCPIQTACLSREAQAGERWALAVLDHRLPATTRPSCGTRTGAKQHRAAGEDTCEPCRAAMRERWYRQQAAREQKRAGRPPQPNREADLRDLLASGASISDACRALNVTRAALQKWCGKRGLHDLYRALSERERRGANQWTRGAA